MKLDSFSHSYGQNAYHIVLVPKYRKSIFLDEIRDRLVEIFHQIADKYDMVIHELKVLADHVHLFVGVNPKFSLSNLFQYLKGISARMLFKEFPELKEELWGGHLWSRGKFFRSVGSVTDDAIQHYIRESQGSY